MKNGIHWNPINWWIDDTGPRRQLGYFRDEYLVWGDISGDDYTLLCISSATNGQDITTEVRNMRVTVSRAFMDYRSSEAISKQHYSRQSEPNNFPNPSASSNPSAFLSRSSLEIEVVLGYAADLLCVGQEVLTESLTGP